MKGNPQVIAGLQEAANMEGSMMLQYLLDQRDVKRLGLDLADGLKQLQGAVRGPHEVPGEPRAVPRRRAHD